MVLDYLLNQAKLLPGKANTACQGHIRLHPELRFAFRAMNMHMHSAFFTRKKEEPVATFSENSWAHFN
jgi:hypothetical protein